MRVLFERDVLVLYGGDVDEEAEQFRQQHEEGMAERLRLALHCSVFEQAVDCIPKRVFRRGG